MTTTNGQSMTETDSLSTQSMTPDQLAATTVQQIQSNFPALDTGACQELQQQMTDLMTGWWNENGLFSQTTNSNSATLAGAAS